MGCAAVDPEDVPKETLRSPPKESAFALREGPVANPTDLPAESLRALEGAESPGKEMLGGVPFPFGAVDTRSHTRMIRLTAWVGRAFGMAEAEIVGPNWHGARRIRQMDRMDLGIGGVELRSWQLEILRHRVLDDIHFGKIREEQRRALSEIRETIEAGDRLQLALFILAATVSSMVIAIFELLP